jgi:HD-like signal output (HDOD) protein
MGNITSYLRNTKLPVMPEVATLLINSLDDPEAGRTVVCNIIAKDPALTATLIRMANSAIFGLSRSVGSLDSAVNVVGVSQIRARALSICMGKMFEMPTGLNRLDYWRNSLVCAGYAKWLAGSINVDENEIWLIAVMLRLGEIIIGQNDPALITPIEIKPCAPGERWAREKTLIGFDEGQIMAEVARRWDFPESVVVALGSCMDPLAATAFSAQAGVVHLASLLADHASPHPELAKVLPAALLQKLQLDLPKLQMQLPDPESFGDVSMMQ